MIYSAEVQHMCPLAKGAYHGPAPIPEEGKWVQAKQISDISGLTHGVGWCAPQQGACKLLTPRTCKIHLPPSIVAISSWLNLPLNFILYFSLSFSFIFTS